MSNLSAEVRSEISFLREIQYDLAIQDLKCGASDEAKSLRSKVIARMALLAPYVAKAAKIATHVAALVAVLIFNFSAMAQEHRHPGETIYGATALFYKSWMRPDAPESSCCNDQDCYVTRVRRVRGKLQAIHRESGDWIDIPPEKIEQNRDSPDGMSHMCASVTKFVFCFKEGGGT